MYLLFKKRKITGKEWGEERKRAKIWRRGQIGPKLTCKGKNCKYWGKGEKMIIKGLQEKEHR